MFNNYVLILCERCKIFNISRLVINNKFKILIKCIQIVIKVYTFFLFLCYNFKRRLVVKKNISIAMQNYTIEAITNGAEHFNNIVLCFHGFNGDKWGDAYSGLKPILKNSLLVSFNSCGHGDSAVSSENMRLNLILEEIEVVVNYLKKEIPNKPIFFVSLSYGAYRVMQYLIKFKPNIKKSIYINPAFRILQCLEKVREFTYSELKENEKVLMKRSLNKYIKKDFLDDLFKNDLYSKVYDINYDSEIIVGSRDTLIPVSDILEIANNYNYKVTYIDEEHCFENKDSWQVIANMIEELE